MLTPIFWPLSDYKIHGGWDWLELKWLAANYAVLTAVWLWLAWQRRRARQNEKK